MLFVDCNRHEIKFILSCRHVISFHFPTNRMAIWYRPPDDLSRTFFCLLAVTYLWHHHNHIQVSLVVGDGLVHICNNLSNAARYRSVQCNDNRCFRLFYPPLLPAWHLAESCACAKVFGLWNRLMCASLWWSSYYASTETRGTITETSKHWNRLVSLNVLGPKFRLLNFTCNLDWICLI